MSNVASSWNVQHCEDCDNGFTLLNSSKTPIVFSARIVNVDIAQILSEIEMTGIPIACSEGLKEIYFTILKEDSLERDPNYKLFTYGDYDNEDLVIRVSWGLEERKQVVETIIHEIGHHVDGIELISDYDDFISECKEKSKYLPKRFRPHPLKDPCEYFAMGFEAFYVGTKEEKKLIRLNNPILWKSLLKINRKYKNK